MEEPILICYYCSKPIPAREVGKHRFCIDATPGFKEYDDVCQACQKTSTPSYNEELAYMVETGEAPEGW